MKRKKTLEHQWLEVGGRRRGLDDRGAGELKRLQRGFEGEVEMDRFVEAYGGNGWQVYRDVWLDCGGITQIDIMIVTAGGIYVCDAKNYSGDYVYADGRWYAGGRLLNRDIFVQLKRSMEKVNDMCTRIGPDIRAEGAVVFVNEHFELEMESSVFERVVMRNRIRKYLVEIDTAAVAGRLHVDRLCRAVETYMIENPYKPPVCDAGMYSLLAKGVNCVGCGSYGVGVGYRFIHCQNCRMKEGKEKGILRMICEYGVLMHHKDLILHDIYEFLGGEVEKRYLKTILGKYFKVLSRGKYAKYSNPRQIFDYSFGHLSFFYKDVAAR